MPTLFARTINFVGALYFLGLLFLVWRRWPVMRPAVLVGFVWAGMTAVFYAYLVTRQCLTGPITPGLTLTTVSTAIRFVALFGGAGVITVYLLRYR